MTKDKLSRRRSLHIIGVGVLAAPAILSLSACSGGGSGESSGGGAGGAQSCDSTIDAQSRQMRTTLQYREASQTAGQSCSSCAQFQAGQYGECGGCTLFTGPVQPGGHCLSWAALAT